MKDTKCEKNIGKMAEMLSDIIKTNPDDMDDYFRIYADSFLGNGSNSEGTQAPKIKSEDVQRKVRIYDPEQSGFTETKYGATATQHKRTEVIGKIPQFAILPKSDAKAAIETAKKEWSKNVVGLDDIFDKILLHIVNYIRCGHTRPLLFVGSPGTGKTTVARAFADLLSLKSYYINAPRAGTSRGLYGDSGDFQDADCGEIISAMIKTNTGNPVIIIDEIDKASPFANSRSACNLQNEALNLLDECADIFFDNFLQVSVDVSYCPIILTANELDDISAPLVDRCEVIRFPELTEEHIAQVVLRSVLPELVEKLQCAREIVIDDGIVISAVHSMFSEGVRSIRAYQSAFENALSGAFIRSLVTGMPQTLQADDIQAARNNTANKISRLIGF